MLVLTRKEGEKITITPSQELLPGVQIELTLVSIRGDKCRIGVNAPASVRVDRNEIHERRMEAAKPRPVNEDGTWAEEPNGNKSPANTPSK